MELSRLYEPFGTDKVSWRAQTVNERNGQTTALALAYIDARDVMERLDEVCGPENWQDRYPHANTKTCCEIGIKIGDEWVWKSDGAGDTDIEGDKGAFSDAFKRAAVRWGIGRYLYELDAPWVPCEAHKRGDRLVFKKFTKDPWACLKAKKAPPADQEAWGGPLKKMELKDRLRKFNTVMEECQDGMELVGIVNDNIDVLNQCRKDLPGWWMTKPGSDILGFDDRIKEKFDELNAKEVNPLG